MAFDLEEFERCCYKRDKEGGLRLLVELLQGLDAHYGLPAPDYTAKPMGSIGAAAIQSHVWTRAAAAASCLLSDPELWIAKDWQLRVLTLHRWLGALFSATPFRSADHILRSLNINTEDNNKENLVIKDEDLLKFILLYTSESEIPVDLDALWNKNPALTAGMCLVLLSPRFLGSKAAHGKREVILTWLSARLDQIEDIELLPVGVLHDAYMHCSYADAPNKHAIKIPINHLIRRKLSKEGVSAYSFDASTANLSPEVKPCMVVVLEWFTKNHSIYRTHSRTLELAREKFKVVAMGYADCLDELTQSVFDEFVAIDRNNSLVEQLRLIQNECTVRDAQVLYMPSVGMFPLTMWMANLRVAPLQLMALGHPATSHSDAIDYVVVETDYVGDPACFSEKLLMLPSDGMPYRPSAAAEGIKVIKQPEAHPDVVKIAVCSTTMKLNPGFLDACARIAREARVKVHFQFLIGQNQGLVSPLLESVVKDYLGDKVTVFPHLNYAAYMDIIAGCDMYINPFPFGNTNGIIDTTTAGLVGVCKTGPEVHEHIDEGLFKRIGLPAWLTAKTVEEYVGAAIRLAENHVERLALRLKHTGTDKVQILFEGRPEIFGQKVFSLLEQTRKEFRENA